MFKYILFDLDNTLYSARYGLEDAVSRRILAFLTRFLGLSADETARERRRALKKYGTTLEWLIAERGFTGADSYYAEIHPPEEAAALEPDPALRDFLTGILLPKAILTNAPREHAERILDKLCVRDCFTHIFDMRWNNFVGKPAPETFRRALDTLGVTPAEALFVDDYPQYVDGYRALGGPGILFDELNAHPGYPPPRIQALREISGVLSG